MTNKFKCNKCGKRHHVSNCRKEDPPRNYISNTDEQNREQSPERENTVNQGREQHPDGRETTATHASVRNYNNSVLIQTAKAGVLDCNKQHHDVARIMLGTESQFS